MKDEKITPKEQEVTRDEGGRWAKGSSGNPNGRPRGHSITLTLQEIMDEKPEIKRALVSKLLQLALEDGDFQSIKLLWNYLDGLPLQSTDITTDGDKLENLIIYKPERIEQGKGE